MMTTRGDIIRDSFIREVTQDMLSYRLWGVEQTRENHKDNNDPVVVLYADNGQSIDVTDSVLACQFKDDTIVLWLKDVESGFRYSVYSDKGIWFDRKPFFFALWNMMGEEIKTIREIVLVK